MDPVKEEKVECRCRYGEQCTCGDDCDCAFCPCDTKCCKNRITTCECKKESEN